MEFNADGSLKLSGSSVKRSEDNAYKMQNTRCVTVTRNVTSSRSPKQCTVLFEASNMLEKGFIERTFGFFSKRVDSTVKLIKLSDTEFQMIVGGEFSRCRDCQHFVSLFREHLEGGVIEKKGSCTFKGISSF
jgi:hypothetical protein